MDEEMPGPMLIGRITWVLYHGYASSHVENLTVRMAHTPLDVLTEVFTANYPSSTLEQVAFVDYLSTEGPDGTEITVVLDTPFYYNGMDNLLIDTEYGGGNSYSCNWGWASGSQRGLMGWPGSSTGDLWDMLPYMILESPAAMKGETFGGVKVILGGGQGEMP